MCYFLSGLTTYMGGYFFLCAYLASKTAGRCVSNCLRLSHKRGHHTKATGLVNTFFFSHKHARPLKLNVARLFSFFVFRIFFEFFLSFLWQQRTHKHTHSTHAHTLPLLLVINNVEQRLLLLGPPR